ncbi:MAG: hypothetical protein GW949_09655 [Spirochaetales bacterium]|nr:hypothetical protein [Spirochaetales bacterium]
MILPKNNPVRSRVDSGLGILTLSDGQGTNRLDVPFLQALLSALEELLRNPAVRVILLRSAEENFCLGMNLDVLKESLDKGASDERSDDSNSNQEAARADGVSLYGQVLDLIAFGPKPVLSLVEGPVKAGGIGLIAASDIVVAHGQKASFELSEVLFGLIPANVLPFLMQQRISPQRARYLVLSAKLLTATEAQHLGMIDEVYEEPELEKGLRSLIKTMMRAEPGALASAKRFIASNIDSDFPEFRDAAHDELLSLMTKPAVAQGLKAFSIGEMPPWFDRFKPSQNLTGAQFQQKGVTA